MCSVRTGLCINPCDLSQEFVYMERATVANGTSFLDKCENRICFRKYRICNFTAITLCYIYCMDVTAVWSGTYIT